MRWLGYLVAGFLVLELLSAAIQAGAILLLIVFLLLLARFPKEVLSLALLSAFLGLMKAQPLVGLIAVGGLVLAGLLARESE